MQEDGRPQSTYERWIEQEGLPVTDASVGIEDLREVPRGAWGRLGGYGGFIQLLGTVQAGRGVYVGEIPSGGALNPEKHMYEEVLYILQGRGLTEVWADPDTGRGKQTFEWGEGSLFSPPLNTWHRLVNGGREPVLFLGVTNAPQVMDTYHSIDFVFNCDYKFADRYTGQGDFFTPSDKRYRGIPNVIWETNFIPDARQVSLEHAEWKASGNRNVQYEIAGNVLMGHIAEWPVGRYQKAHVHGPGAILIALQGKGYNLMWPKEVGIHPYQAEREDAVVELHWKPASLWGPPDGWFHMHLSTSREPARLLAIRYGSYLHRSSSRSMMGEEGTYTSVRKGGGLIEYEDEDPEIRRRFEEALHREGVEYTMPAVVYRQ